MDSGRDFRVAVEFIILNPGGLKMRPANLYTVLTILIALILTGCMSDSHEPVTGLNVSPDMLPVAQSISESNTHLWGYFDCYVDLEREEINAVVSRTAVATLNVVPFLNLHPENLSFDFLGFHSDPEIIALLVDITITHPIPDNPRYDGYDVRGVMMCEGSGTFEYDSDLHYPVEGTDQFLDNADGYTRWYNPTEFTVPGICGYTEGVYATDDYRPGATVNPYKYYADDLSAPSNLWNFLRSTTGSGRFASGASNARQYEIRFPQPDPGLKFGYAVLANWEGPDPADHPSNTPEAVGILVYVTPDVFYIDEVYNGGTLILDMLVFGWWIQPQSILIESTVLSSIHQLTPEEMIPVYGDQYVSTYHVEIPADNVRSNVGNEYWIICAYDDEYHNKYQVPNLTGDDPLAAFFRFEMFVADTLYNSPPVCDLDVVTEMPFEGYINAPVTFDATGSYDPDDPDRILTYRWDFNGNGIYDEVPQDSWIGSVEYPTHVYSETFNGNVGLIVSDNEDGDTECSAEVDVTIVTNLDPFCDLEILTPMPAIGTSVVEVEFDASGSFDPDPGDILGFAWDFNGNGIFNEDPEDEYSGTPENPTHPYYADYLGLACVWVTDGNGGEDTCCLAVDVTVE